MSDIDTLDDPFPDVSNELEPAVETEAPESSATDPVPTDTSDSAADNATPRDEHGRFTTKQPTTEANPTATADAPASADAGKVAQPGEGEAIDKQEGPAPSWQPLTVKADRETLSLADTLGAQFFSDPASGHVMIALPEANLARLQQMIGKGHVADKRWRDFEAQRTAFETEKNKPRPPSDAEIEAREVLAYLTPVLPQMLSDADLKWLEDKVALAKLRSQTESRTKEEQWSKQQAEAGQVDTFQSEQLAAWIESLAQEKEFEGIPPQQLKELYDDLNETKGALFVQQKADGQLHERFAIRDDVLRKRLGRLATNAKAQAESERKRKEAEERNKKLNATPVNKTPPAPAKRSGSTTATKGKDVSKMTYAEYRDYVMSSEFDRE